MTQPLKPLVFEEFFELGQQETVSPFLKPESRQWGANLTLKASIAAAFLLLAAFTLSFFPRILPLSHFLLVVVYFLAGIPSLIEAVEDLANFEINIDILMTLAAFSSILIGSSMEGALLLVLFALSGSMEDAVTMKAKSSISSLHRLSPTKASVIENDGMLIERSIKDIPIGTHILIKSGQVVPLDGEVIDGASSVNLVHLTGENFPISKQIGDEVAAGARNLEGMLVLKVSKTSSDSTLARIIQLVTQAQEARPRLQRWFDELSRYYAIGIISFAALCAITFPWLFSMPFLGTGGSVYRALTFLIAASPCALIIAIPIAYLSAVSACARRGILLKGGVVLDALAKCKVIAFDKTGTLTTGDLSFQSIEPLSGNVEGALSIAYALERNAVHPVAKAIVSYAQMHQIAPVALQEFKSIPGKGLEAAMDKVAVAIGRPNFIAAKLPAYLAETLMERVDVLQGEGELVSPLVIGESVYLLRFIDTPRKGIKKTIDALKKQGLEVLMLTGDHATSAKRTAGELGVTDYRSDLHPEDKLNIVAELSLKDGVAMIGDGINDAPALARATVGIGMGKVGSTAALDAADAILLQDNIEMLGWLMHKAKQTQAIVKQNLTLAAAAIVLASIPALAGTIPLWLAVVLHEGGTVLVGLNGLRLLRK